MARAKPTCLIVSSDYLDLDVALNVRAFYGCAGYRIRAEPCRSAAVDLLVVLRGDNGTSHGDFRGEIHIYDYVKEYTVDWEARYPQAARILLISLAALPSGRGGAMASARDPSTPPAACTTSTAGAAAGAVAGAAAGRAPCAAALSTPTPPGSAARLRWIEAYLPVIPALWQLPWQRKDRLPLHLSNYKRMAGDRYQSQLLEQIQAGSVAVYGSNWQLVGVATHPLSYWQANRRLARSARCFGLMWPYQRGRTLSGRMWQAPLQGCFVLSEAGTDPLGVPGVQQLPSFEPSGLPPFPDGQACRQLRQEAATFWEAHTRHLAACLGFPADLPLAGAPLRRQRWALWCNHLAFRFGRLLQAWQALVNPPLARLRRGLARGARRLGCPPRPRP